MILRRSQLYKRKIIGGSLFGNLFNAGKKLATSATKVALKNAGQSAKNVLKSGNVKNLITSKVKDIAKTQLGVSDLSRKALTDLARTQVKSLAKDQFGISSLADAKKLALTTATQKANSLGSDLAKKALSKVSRSSLSPALKQTINALAGNSKSKSVLKKKSQQILSQALASSPTSIDTSRALVSNILAGSGQMYGSGIKRIV